MENKSKNIELVAKTGDLRAVFKSILEESPEILTGFLEKVGGEVFSSPMRIFHASLKGNFLKQLAAEAEKLRRNGEVKEDYFETNQAKACFVELMDIVDKKSPDPARLDAIKKVFLTIATEKLGNRNDPLPQQILSIVGDLSAGELILLAAMYKAGGMNVYTAVEQWISEMADKTRFMRVELVVLHEQKLIGKLLVLPRHVATENRITWGQRNRLTDLGIAVCEFLSIGKESV